MSKRRVSIDQTTHGAPILTARAGGQDLEITDPAKALLRQVEELQAAENAEIDAIRAPFEARCAEAKAPGAKVSLAERAELRAMKTEIEQQEAAIIGKYVGEMRRLLRPASLDVVRRAGLEELHEQVVPWDSPNPAPADAPLVELLGAGAEE